MPGLTHRNAQFSIASSTKYSSSCSGGSISANGIWSNLGDDVTFDQLQKFWSSLTPQARQELLRIDKQTLFEQARKSLYCSRCNGLLLEGFSQIVMYGKSLQQEGAVGNQPGNRGALKSQYDNGGNVMPSNCQDDVQDPSVHPWGGLAATKDGLLTLLDCFLSAKSLKAIQNVFDSARAREREREMLYPDACGGGGRGWISQGTASYGRGHGIRETCALHTARVSCDTLVDFWSALGDETRQSLLRMKEDDFIERLMYRFDSKRFCRDCRRNVIREFKELKELKRMRKEPHCTSWFCVADTAFQYEVSANTVQADWHQSFIDTVGTYHHFEWALGTGEGKSDIMEFQDVGMDGRVRVDGLDLAGLSACFITLRAWKLDGRCMELSVKAHALKGQPCVHRRLVVGDGFVTITKGESIRRFFEHAEEAEEEEDDDSMDKDGNELDGESYHPQKHAKSPELAREFLLDAATVIFKEQVEKAFREGTARQNAHSIFLSLALRLLERRIHVACKEIITYEMQTKLLEEEEKEKREEEERKERRRAKERDKKLRRKERLKGKEKDKEMNCVESKKTPLNLDICTEEQSAVGEESSTNSINSGDSIGDTVDGSIADPPQEYQDDQFSYDGCVDLTMLNYKDDCIRPMYNTSDGEVSVRDGNGLFTIEQSKSSQRKLSYRRECQLDPASKSCDRGRTPITSVDGPQLDELDTRLPVAHAKNPARCNNGNRQPRFNPLKSDSRNCLLKSGEKYQSSNRMRDRYDFRSCGCNQNNGYRSKVCQHIPVIRSCREVKTGNKLDSSSDISRSFSRSNKYSNGCHISDNYGIPKGKVTPGRDFLHTKKVWEPLESRKKYLHNNPESEVSLGSTLKVDECEEGGYKEVSLVQQQPDNPLELPSEACSSKQSENSKNAVGLDYFTSLKDDTGNKSQIADQGMEKDNQKGFTLGDKSPYYSKDVASSSDNCSSCLSEGDSSSASSNIQNVESLPTSDSEDASQQSEGRDASSCGQNGFLECQDVGVDNKLNADRRESHMNKKIVGVPEATCMSRGSFPGDLPIKDAHNPDSGRVAMDIGTQQHRVPPLINNGNLHYPVFPTPSTMGYYHQHPAAWAGAPANGLLPFSQPNRYLFTSPLGYGLSANRPSHFCVQYSALQPLAPPVLNVGQLPVYQPVNNGNGLMAVDQNQNSRLFVEQEAAKLDDAVVSPLGRSAPNGQTLLESPSHGEEEHHGHSDKLPNDGTNFSLFHFGGPIAVATGHDYKPKSLKRGTSQDLPPNSAACPTHVDTCGKETAVEEYSLFASSNGTRFSFF